MKADSTSAVDAVVKADTKRTALLEECERLQKAAEEGKDKKGDEERLKEVCGFGIRNKEVLVSSVGNF